MGLEITIKPGGKFYIGDDTSVALSENERHSVKLRIEAPKEINIAREEILSECEIDEIEYNINQNRTKRRARK